MARHKDALYDTVHPLLGNAIRAVAEQHRPTQPFHLGGPLPVLSAMAQSAIAIRCAEVMVDWIPPQERDEYDSIVEAAHTLVQYQLARKRGSPTIDIQRASELFRLAKVGRDRPGLFPLAPLAVSSLGARYDLVGNVVRSSTIRIARALDEAGKHDELQQYFAGLDQGICRHECQAAVDRYAAPPVPQVQQVIWRQDRGNGTAGHFLFGIADRRDFGLVTKLRGRWRYVTGDRDQVLATLPDDHFAAGTDAFFAALNSTD